MGRLKTAALLPTPGNPYLVLYWLRNFDRVWRNEVDELRVHVNQQPDADVRTWIRGQVEAFGGIYSERTDSSTHGIAIRDLISATDADVVLLCEDDAMVRRGEAVARRLARVRDGLADVVGAPRVSMTKELESAGIARWGRNEWTPDGGEGHGMWPAFVFARRDALLATDGDYDAHAWHRGDVVAGLDLVVSSEVECADTFGSTALQLRSLCRVEDDVQYKGPHHWERWLSDGHDIPWFHCGSLSSSGNLACEHDLAGGLESFGPEDWPEWAHRLAWWRRVLDKAGPYALPERQDVYRGNWERLCSSISSGIPIDMIDAWDEVISRMVTWDET